MTGPDFFIVGAPKCGTTALDAYLSQHPQILMGRKEQHFFGSDLAEIWRHPGAGERPSAEEYFGMFAGSNWATHRGESSVWYLRSERAAHEIHAYNPDARIVAMVRNPVDMLASLHSQFLHDEIENLEDFAEALAAEPDRRAGRRIPPHNGTPPWRLFYREIARFDEQLERYFTVFGRERVHVVLYDDFARDTPGAYREVLKFLEVETTFEPTFRVVNANKRIRSRSLQHMFWEIYDPSSSIRRVGRRLLPIHRMRLAMLRDLAPALQRLNSATAPRPPVEPRLRAGLEAELAGDVEALGRLIGRDLSHWTGHDAARAA